MILNKQQTCSFLGWTAYQFDKAVTEGFPAKKRAKSRGHDWLVESRECVAWVVERAVIAAVEAAGSAPGSGSLDLAGERTRLAKEQADGQALRNAVARGELLPADEVVTAWQASISRARSLLLGIPMCATEVVAAVEGKAGQAALVTAREILTTKIFDALDELARQDPLGDEDENAAA